MIAHIRDINLAAIIYFYLYCDNEILPTSAHYSNNNEASACVCVCVCVFLEAPSLRNMADTMATALHCYCFRHDVNGARVVIEQTHVLEKVTFNKHL